MKTKVLRRLSAIVCLLLIFNSIGSYASTPTFSDDTNALSLTSEATSSSLNPNSMRYYLGKYYSDFNDAEHYNSTARLQYRANHYGYAFRMFYAADQFPTNQTSYQQVVGEFASKSTASPLFIYISETHYRTVSNYSSLKTCISDIFNIENTTNQWRMSAIVQLMQADAEALGYTVTEYTGASIPDATNDNEKRLVALVVNDNNYYFYMQHSDNTWSHKASYGSPRNTCYNHSTVLTNSNIRSHASEGFYGNGELKFFYITKNAVIDYKHRDGTSSGTTQTRIYSTDGAGNTIYSASDIGDWPYDYITGCIDYPTDTDFYTLYSGIEGSKTLYIDSYAGYVLELCIYDDSGNLLASESTSSSTSLTFTVEVDRPYFISVRATDFVEYQYNVGYEIY